MYFGSCNSRIKFIVDIKSPFILYHYIKNDNNLSYDNRPSRFAYGNYGRYVTEGKNIFEISFGKNTGGLRGDIFMKTILIIGLGRFGRHMAKKFLEEGNDVFAVEKDEERADNAVDFVQNIQIGDATDERFVKSLGINNFDICAVTVGNDFQTALEITVILKDLGAKFIIARASRDVHRKLLMRNGASVKPMLTWNSYLCAS